MINLEENFKEHEKELTGFLLQQKNGYFKSKCFKRLQDRYYRLKASNDMQFKDSAYASKVIFPIVKERTLIRIAILSQNFRGEPIITVEPAGATPTDNAKNAQELLNANFKSTNFRGKAFRIIKEDCAQYGAAVCYSAWQESKKESMKTVDTPLGPDRKRVPSVKKNCLNNAVHILDYFQNPDIADPDDSEYQGHIERINLSKMKVLAQQAPEMYIKENMIELLKQAHKQAMEDKDHHSEADKLDNNPQSFPIDRVVMYSTCNIKGNEDNENYYYIEMIGDKIIRIQENPHDDDLRPYATFTFYPRREYWWGNSDAEFVLPHERFTNHLMSMKADAAMRALQSYIFYEKGAIDTADWNNRHKNGGMIGVDSKNNKALSQLLYQVQPQDYSLQGTDAMMREIKESQQRLTPRPDFTRASTQGGLRNSTATAAQILDEQGDVAEAQILENFMFGVKRVGHNNMVIMTQRLGDVFAIRPNMNESQRILDKSQIMGQYNYFVETSLNKNKASELMRLQNMLTAIMNFKGSGDPAFQNLDVVPLVRKILKNADIGDVDEYIMATPPATAVPDAMLQGQEQAGGIGMEVMPGQPQEGVLNAA